MGVKLKSLSAGFFCPQAKAPDGEYLDALHSFLAGNKHGQALLSEITALKTANIWSVFATARDDIKGFSRGPDYIDLLFNWATEKASEPISEVLSGIIALPLLIIVQIGQYLRFLDFHGMKHQEFLEDVRPGGLQGFCGGLASAMAISCAKDEAEVVMHTATALRIFVGLGAYSEIADKTGDTGSTTLAVRLKYESQGEEITRRFPGTYVSSIPMPLAVGIVGPAHTLHELFCYAKDHEGLQVQKLEVRGKVHNPENEHLAIEFCQFCRGRPELQLPDASSLQVPVRSNRTTQKIAHGSLTEELVRTVLVYRCEWYKILTEVAKDVSQEQCREPTFVYIGLTDSVSLAPFHTLGLQPTKFGASSLIKRDQVLRVLGTPSFPDDALAVVGASCRLPGANNLQELWDMVATGTDCHEKLPTNRFDLHGGYRAAQSGAFANERTFYGNFIDDIQRFDNAFFGINPREAANMDPQQRILLELAYEALDDAGYLAKHRREDGDDVGCFIGASFVEYLDNTTAHAPTAYTSTGTIRAFLCGRLSYHFGWSGPSEVIDTACSSSLVAINRACKAVQAGECRMALTGGINIITGTTNYFDLAKAGFLSPTGQCKPFDASADGYCRSDGAGLVVVKKLQHALADGDAIMGVIPAIATNQGGLSSSITVPESAAQKALYQKVLQQAGLQPENISYVEAHGTGTQAGDPLEIESIRSVFGKRSLNSGQYALSIGSVKGNLGHCETAAGVAGLLKVLAMIKHHHIPPQASHSSLNPKIQPLEPDGLEIALSLRQWNAPFRAAMVNSYGAAGSNCALLCCEMSPAPRGRETIELSNMKFPLLLSAASEEALVENCRTLGKYLRQQKETPHLADIALTMNSRRRLSKFRTSIEAKSVEEGADLLESLKLDAIFEAQKQPKPIVFAFSGQFDNKVGLDRSFYDHVPTFRLHLDACDAEIRKLGYSSIVPSVFDTQPASDVTALQCGIFAMQYSCALSWMDAGLKPSAIIGHSLGELAALAISGILSLPDAIKLVATRANLIDTKWGPEKGAMLALSSCSVQDFESLHSLLQERSSVPIPLEIACYNAPTSLVIVGTASAITAAEDVLRSESAFQKVRSRRLRTSHGFHSSLMQPILSDLAVVSKVLDWNEPKIPLEACALEPPSSIQEDYPPKHARTPVFFAKAVQRLEERLGPSIWLEAGINTPVIPMISQACRQPDKHEFLAMKPKQTSRPLEVVTATVSRLWRSGHLVNHWQLLQGKEGGGVKPVWLPPYQFKKTQHWVPNIDRVMEMMQKTSTTTEQQKIESLPPPRQLVIWKDAPSKAVRKHHDKAEFLVNTQSQRFHEIISGHAVRSRSLCPASMYMECVAMALQLLLPRSVMVTFKGASMVFEEFCVKSPLGLHPEGEVSIQLEQGDNTSSWQFVVRTSSKPRTTVHASGIISLATSPGFDAYERLVSGAIDRIEHCEKGVERLMAKRAYDLFARVVDYSHCFRGIRSIVLHERESVATIRLPAEQPSREESTAWKMCDAITVDAYIQVVGLLMNSSDVVASNEVMVMVGLDRAVISPKCDMNIPSKEWRVYVKFGFSYDQQPIGDVFVCTADGQLVALLCGCRFTKLLISRLERTLDVASSTSKREQSQRVNSSSTSTVSSPMAVDTDTPATSITSSTQPMSDLHKALRDLTAEYIGIEGSDMPDENSLVDLGLDSLASLELVGELASKFHIKVSSDELGTKTLQDLYQELAYRVSQLPPHGSPGREETLGQAKISGTSENQDNEENRSNFRVLLQVLAEISGAKPDDISPSDMLDSIGVDSLAAIDLKQELENRFSIRINDIVVEDTVQDVMAQLGIQTSTQKQPKPSPNGHGASTDTHNTSTPQTPGAEGSLITQNPFRVLEKSDTYFETFAQKRGFLGYWSAVAPLKVNFLLAFIVEAFDALGVDLRRANSEERLSQISFRTPKYDKLVSRLWEILRSHDIVSLHSAGGFTRGRSEIDERSSTQLLAEFQQRFPSYETEIEFIKLTGPRLAECLVGQVDPVTLMFGSPTSMKIMENYYANSPMISTMTDQLVAFIKYLLETFDAARPARILEVGAGTGGTTKRLAAALASAGLSASYTFSDISPSFVSKAKKSLNKYPWIDYLTFNLEKEVPDALRGRFDIVIGTNCVHATSNRTASCRRLLETLVPGGIVVLSEVTRVVDWYDICFGLLDGWWLAEGGTEYPIQPAEKWVSALKTAGFASVGYSGGPTAESTTQQLIVACTKHWDVPR
ncbi:BcPKS16, polyketide synthase [Dactylonectria macrodidyma]|uniref:BcPKS16, polyketide synthase n=1 Tax=Dactylonectria macrodidyma TaxID=307937 RepID=A0A9P9IZW9_9HYPO|nr:BcPKS16, polyketide synthase [Dactylonectria macrodidyma]